MHLACTSQVGKHSGKEVPYDEAPFRTLQSFSTKFATDEVMQARAPRRARPVHAVAARAAAVRRCSYLLFTPALHTPAHTSAQSEAYHMMFKSYYGDNNWADKWNMAALDSTPTAFTSGRGNADFAAVNDPATLNQVRCPPPCCAHTGHLRGEGLEP